jgi:biotin carboxyl carrier protein
MGWLSFQKSKNLHSKLSTFQNPVQTLADLYHFLRLEQHSGVPPSEQIWSNDQKLLETASAFYSELKTRFGKTDLSWQELREILSAEKPPAKFKLGKNLKLWEGISAAHKGHQMSMELLQLPSILAKKAGYYDFRGNNTLEVKIPKEFQDPESNEELIAKLAPPPSAKSNEILAWTGGTFYSRETPEAGEYVREGQHVEEGDVLGLLEVMKMFNQIRAEFPGTIRKICIDASTGKIVARSQVLFQIDPDNPPVSETEEELFKRQQEQTISLMQSIIPAN